MDEKEYNKLVKERDDHNKRINDQFTTEDQRNFSKQRVAEINKLTADYESKNKPERRAPEKIFFRFIFDFLDFQSIPDDYWISSEA